MTDKTPKMVGQGQTFTEMTNSPQEIADKIATTPANRNVSVNEKGLNVDIPADLHQDLKLITTFNGITVKQAVTNELQKYVKKEMKKMVEKFKDKY